MNAYANQARRQDVGYARQQAYKRNEKRVKRQLRKTKVKNVIKRLTKKDD